MKIILSFLCSVVFTISFAQDIDILKFSCNSELRAKKNDISFVDYDTRAQKLNFGIQAGFHSPNLSNNSSMDFNRGFFGEFYLGYNISDEVLVLIAFNYWEAQTNQISSPSTQIPSKTVISKAIKMELDFSLFKIYSFSILFGPSVLIENINTAVEGVFTLGANLKFKLPLTVLHERVKILATINYQYGNELLNVGGGMQYSFFGYLLGAEIGI